jgi:hypothetical protein
MKIDVEIEKIENGFLITLDGKKYMTHSNALKGVVSNREKD